MIPWAVYMGLFTRWARPDIYVSPAWYAAILILIALSGLAIVIYRRTPFLGGVIQMTTTPLAIAGLVASTNLLNLMDPINPRTGWLFLTGSVWGLLGLLATLRFLLLHRSRAPRPEPEGAALVLQSIEAGLANLALLVLSGVLVPAVLVGGFLLVRFLLGR